MNFINNVSKKPIAQDDPIIFEFIGDYRNQPCPNEPERQMVPHVGMASNMTMGRLFIGLWTSGVGPCTVVCMFGGTHIMSPIAMGHSSFGANDLLPHALTTLEKWRKLPGDMRVDETQLRTVLIGGSQDNLIDTSVLNNESYKKLNILGLVTPVQQSDGNSGQIWIGGQKASDEKDLKTRFWLCDNPAPSRFR